MIYDEPIFRPLGDCYLAVDFGDEVNLALSFRVIALLDALAAARLPGVVELQPTGREIAVAFDRERTTAAAIEAAIREILQEPLLEQPIPSRLIEMPMWYGDPWTIATAERFGVPNNLEFVAEHNGMTTGELVERHTGCVFWNSAVGFAPGCNLHYPLEDHGITAPAYDTPRTFTPARAVGVLGAGTSSYPVTSPGGTQLVGRLPIEIYQPNTTNDAFGADGVLLRTGDRLQYRKIDALEYDEIRDQVVRGTYEYRIVDERFDARAYLDARANASEGSVA
jgi:KipI family sensor histidine kinase inhibitor